MVGNPNIGCAPDARRHAVGAVLSADITNDEINEIGLTHEITLAAAVRSTHANGNSDWVAAVDSSGNTATASPIAPIAPNPPQNVTAEAGDGRITVNWQAPAAGGMAVTSYVVCARSTATATATDSITETCTEAGVFGHRRVINSATATTVTLTGGTIEITNGMTYRVGVASRAHEGSADIVSDYIAATPPTVTPMVAPGTDATLRTLTIDSGTLSPVFVSDTYTYTAGVGNEVETLDVTGVPNDATAELDYASDMDSTIGGDGVVDLAVGVNVITITVTAEDGVTMQPYVIRVTRAGVTESSDATLSALSMAGVSPVVLSPVFVSDTHTYTATVAHGVDATTVTATAAAGASAEVTATPGTVTGDVVALVVGGNTITITVTAEDGVTTQPYTVTVTREALPRLSIAATKPTFTEGTDRNASFTVTSDINVPRELSVGVTLGGGDGFVDTRFQEVTIRAGDRMVTVELPDRRRHG